MADTDQGEDDYGDGDYEAESPARSQHVATPPAASPRERQPSLLSEDGLSADESDGRAVTPRHQVWANAKPKRGRQSSPSPDGRHLLDNTPWSYMIWARQVRMLRIPVAESAAIRELRVFATVDKQAAQCRGSRWKQEFQLGGGNAAPMVGSIRDQKVAPHRRSGLIEEAKWLRSDGKLQWTFPMEKFRRLKAYTPRIKAFVYGIGDTAAEERLRPMAEVARQDQDHAIVSFGWFFLDLRCERRRSLLQFALKGRLIAVFNSPFGGEIQISTTFSPVEVSPSKEAANLVGVPAYYEEKVSSTRLMEKTAKTSSGMGVIPTVMTGEIGEYLRIGDSNGADVFVISVFVRTALNLAEMVQAAMGAKREAVHRTGFWLSYSFFDVVVQTDVFFNLEVAEFPPIRDSFRVQSCVQDLKLFFEGLGNLTVFLCTENNVLAGVEIPLRGLLEKELFSAQTADARGPKPGETAMTDGSFSFPDFEDTVVTASVAVEFVQSQESTLDTINRDSELVMEPETVVIGTGQVNNNLAIQARNVGEADDEGVEERVAFRLDHLRLSNAALAPFAGHEGVVIELSVGDRKVTNGVMPFDSDSFVVSDKGEVSIPNFACTFELLKDLLELKREMEASVTIELRTEDAERCVIGFELSVHFATMYPNLYRVYCHSRQAVGNAVFSLNYLFFSEERFSCSETTCEQTFKTQSETEIHWLEAHSDSALPAAHVGSEAYAHAYRSCSISIPVMVLKGESGTTSQPPHRLGFIRVVALLEDVGPVIDTETGPIPRLIAAEKEESLHEASVVSPIASPSAPSVGRAKERSSSTSMVREPGNTIRNASTTKGAPVANQKVSNSQVEAQEMIARRVREQQSEVADLKESLEREKEAWKQEQQLQQLQWKRRFAEMEKSRMDELEEEWARREEERSSLLRSAQEEYQRLEQTLRTSLADLEARERRLTVAEAALQREQRAHREENEFLQKRLKSEQSHTLSLAKRQTEGSERRVALLETQLSDAEKRTKQVEADFTEYRQQQRKVPESRLREEIAALKGNVAELEKQKMAQERACEVAEANVEKLKMQLEKMAKLVLEEKKKHENQVVDELEKLRVKYIAREEKYVLDGDRDELRAIKKQLDDLKGFNLRGNSSNKSSRERHPPRKSTASRSRQQQRSARVSQGHFERLSPAVSRHQRLSFYSDRASLQAGGSNDEEESFVEVDRGELGLATGHDRDRLRTEEEHASYLVRELDRLINVTRANIQHQSLTF
ncbi:hypothetical protein BBJ28_00018364 [Nothophytophthora sp. Chile5]|nr:hypothetical protein BBJ28_00018364 [Nothophytophthora sp. Chile5]